MTADRAPRHRVAVIVTGCCLVLAVALGACGGSDADPAAARRDRVEARLRATYSASQARCVLGRLDTRTIAVLDRRNDLSPTSPEFRRFSAALRTCVVPDATTSTRDP